jgi:hypothetical protein
MVDKFLDLLYKYSDYNMHLDETLQALTDYNLTNYNRDYRRRLLLWGTGKRNVESYIRRKRPSHYFDSSRWLKRGLGSFFIYQYEKKDREQEKQRTIVERQRESRQEQIVRHGNTLISQYNDFVQRNPREKKSDWDECLKKFQFRKEFLQHLLTGHEQLYDLLNDAMTSEKKI